MKSCVRVAAWIVALALLAVTVCPIDFRPTTGLSADLERFIAFCLCGVLFGLAYPRHKLAVVTAVVLGAAGLEAIQYLSPSRHGRMHDFEVKAIAGALGAFSMAVFDRISREISPR
ncbi:VanZ family protein [Alsobacter sp. KACC 23698]|uniref:VanZ family protein n=2 Tax=Alsobacter sp. KACC 23698 TaxID=3149229 RepID=A0AAU7JMQ3_9HYPH